MEMNSVLGEKELPTGKLLPPHISLVTLLGQKMILHFDRIPFVTHFPERETSMIHNSCFSSAIGSHRNVQYRSKRSDRLLRTIDSLTSIL
jgi:hypothetical protein